MDSKSRESYDSHSDFYVGDPTKYLIPKKLNILETTFSFIGNFLYKIRKFLWILLGIIIFLGFISTCVRISLDRESKRELKTETVKEVDSKGNYGLKISKINPDGSITNQ